MKTKLFFLLSFTLGIFNADAQTPALKNTKWKSKSFWGYGYGISSELFSEKTKDPYHDFEFSIEFDSLNFISTNLTLKQSDVKQIKGAYHIFSNGFIKLEIDAVLCIDSSKPCALSHKSDYTQYHKYSLNNDGEIGFLNIQYRNTWIDKIVNDYLKKSQNEKIRKAITDNCYVEWLPTETKKIKGESYSLLKIVYEIGKNDTDFDIKTYTNKYKLLNTLYIQLPSQKVFEMDTTAKKLQEWVVKDK